MLSEVGLDGRVRRGRTHGAGLGRIADVPMSRSSWPGPIAFSERIRRENDPLDAREIDDGIQVSFTTGEVSCRDPDTRKVNGGGPTVGEVPAEL